MAGNIIDLTHGETHLRLAPGIGGSVADFYSLAGTTRIDWFRPTSEESLAKGDILAMAHFPLVPYSGRIRDAVLSFGGREHKLARNVPWEPNALHGDGWQNPWRVLRHNDSVVELEYRHEAGSWPWRYRAWQRIELGPDRLDMSISLTNESPEAMPAGIGLHPWFNSGNGARMTAKAGRIWNTDKGNLFTEVTPVPTRSDFSGGRAIEGSNLNNGFSEWDGKALIEWPEIGARLAIESSPTLRHLVVYTPPGEPYFCAEPVSHSVDAFNLEARGIAGNGTKVLQPGETLEGSARFAGSKRE